MISVIVASLGAGWDGLAFSGWANCRSILKSCGGSLWGGVGVCSMVGLSVGGSFLSGVTVCVECVLGGVCHGGVLLTMNVATLPSGCFLFGETVFFNGSRTLKSTELSGFPK